MAKSAALMKRVKNFAAKVADKVDSTIGNSVVVDNANNPASAYSMAKRKDKTQSPAYKFATKQKTFGTPNAK